MRSKDLIGLPLISIATADELGTVGEIVVNPGQKVVEFLLLERKENDEYTGIPFSQIKGIGDYAVTVKNKNVMIDVMKVGLLKEMIERDINLIGARIISDQGKLLGQVTEYSLELESGKLKDLYFENQDKKEATIEADSVVTIGKERIIVSEQEKEVTVQKKTQPSSNIKTEKEEIQEKMQEKKLNKEQDTTRKKEKKEADAEGGGVLGASKKEEEDPAKAIISRKKQELLGKTLLKDIKTGDGRIVARKNEKITEELYSRVENLGYEVFIELATSVKE